MGDRINRHNLTDLRLVKRPIGTVLVDGGFIKPAELEAALAEQGRTGEPLGEILIRMGLLKTEDLLAVLTTQGRLANLEDALRSVSGPDRTLGELLVMCGRISTETLEAALEEQKLTGRKLGETIAGMGLISMGEVEAALAFQRNIRDGRQEASGFRLGELLVATNLITDEQLSDALCRQKTNKKRLGEVLIEAGYVKEDLVNYGLGLQHRLLAATLAALLSYAVAHDVSAAPGDFSTAGSISGDASIRVSATVKPHATLKVLRQPREIVITYADILRGYVDVDTASEFDIKNNSLSGYLLVFDYSGMAFSEIRVRGLGTDVVFTSGTAWVAQPHRGPAHDFIELSYRFRLSKNVAPGTYAWPLNTSVEPL